MYNIGSSTCEALAQHSRLCDNAEGCSGDGVGERFEREGTHIYILIANSRCCTGETNARL